MARIFEHDCRGAIETRLDLLRGASVEVTLGTTIKQTESAPASYPAKPIGLSAAAAALDAAMIWQRIEGYTAHRYTPRAIVWVVEGCGSWTPPLMPATIETFEQWIGGAWEEAVLSASPLGGYCLPSRAMYRFSGSVGGGAVPAIVSEAYRRLAEYLASATSAAHPGVRQSAIEGIGSHTYDATAVARAMERSGAGDLLRTYRRAA
jgi:hypothetical protein